MDFVGKRHWYLLFSALVVMLGLISLIFYGLPLSIEFTGGALLELQFTDAQDVQPATILGIFAEHGYADAVVETSGEDLVLIRSRPMDPVTKNSIEVEIEERVGSFTELRFELVGPALEGRMVQRGVMVVALAAVVIFLYISWAFRQMPDPLSYGSCALIAMLHDVAVVIGLTSLFGSFLGWEVDIPFLAALLAMIGFSFHNTIVVFDRIGENMTRHRGEPLANVVNHSIIESLSRSINTQLGMAFILLALALLGGFTIKRFALVLLIGFVSGAYSSLFIASQLLVVWETGEAGRFWQRVRRRLLKRLSA